MRLMGGQGQTGQGQNMPVQQTTQTGQTAQAQTAQTGQVAQPGQSFLDKFGNLVSGILGGQQPQTAQTGQTGQTPQTAQAGQQAQGFGNWLKGAGDQIAQSMGFAAPPGVTGAQASNGQYGAYQDPYGQAGAYGNPYASQYPQQPKVESSWLEQAGDYFGMGGTPATGTAAQPGAFTPGQQVQAVDANGAAVTVMVVSVGATGQPVLVNAQGQSVTLSGYNTQGVPIVATGTATTTATPATTVTPTPVVVNPPPPPATDYTLLYLLGGAAVLGVGYFALKQKAPQQQMLPEYAGGYDGGGRASYGQRPSREPRYNPAGRRGRRPASRRRR